MLKKIHHTIFPLFSTKYAWRREGKFSHSIHHLERDYEGMNVECKNERERKERMFCSQTTFIAQAHIVLSASSPVLLLHSMNFIFNTFSFRLAVNENGKEFSLVLWESVFCAVALHYMACIGILWDRC